MTAFATAAAASLSTGNYKGKIKRAGIGSALIHFFNRPWCMDANGRQWRQWSITTRVVTAMAVLEFKNQHHVCHIAWRLKKVSSEKRPWWRLRVQPQHWRVPLGRLPISENSFKCKGTRRCMAQQGNTYFLPRERTPSIAGTENVIKLACAN